MKYKNVTSLESIEFVLSNTFVYSKDLKKGFVKKDLTAVADAINTDYRFNNVVNVIENANYEVLEGANLDMVSFNDGKITISKVISDKITAQVQQLSDPDEIESLVNIAKNSRGYFNATPLLDFQGVIKNVIRTNTIPDFSIGQNQEGSFDVLTMFNAMYPTRTIVSITIDVQPLQAITTINNNQLDILSDENANGSDEIILAMTDTRGVIYKFPVLLAYN